MSYTPAITLRDNYADGAEDPMIIFNEFPATEFRSFDRRGWSSGVRHARQKKVMRPSKPPTTERPAAVITYNITAESRVVMVAIDVERINRRRHRSQTVRGVISYNDEKRLNILIIRPVAVTPTRLFSKQAWTNWHATLLFH